MTTHPQTQLRYLPGLDGIRAIAVLAVMLYHANVATFRGGFLGVDVFFALSGFLITSLLLIEWRTWGALDLLGFWARRARRLLPALFLVLAAVAVYAAVAIAPERLNLIRGDELSTLFYVANWRFVLAGQSYFDQFVEPSPLRHMWSLGIEEQFYLVFPLVLIVLLRFTRGRRWWLAGCFAVGALTSALLMSWWFHPGTDPSRVYYGTDTRVQVLLVGAILAVFVHGSAPRRSTAPDDAEVVSPRRWADVLGLAGLVLLAVAFTQVGSFDTWLYRGGFLGIAVTSTAVIAAVVLAPSGLVARGLGVWPLRITGLISYGLYLWHWPIYIALTPDRTGLDGPSLLALRFAVTFLAAAVSFVVVERPIRKGALGRLPRPLRLSVVVASTVGVIAIVVGGTVGASGPTEQVPSLATFPVQTYALGTPGGARVLVVGDSVGYSLAKSFPRSAFPSVAVSGSTRLGCGLADPHLSIDGNVGAPQSRCDDTFNRWRAALHSFNPTDVVLVSGAWEVFDHVVDGKTLSVGSPEYANYIEQKLEQAVGLLSANGATVTAVNVPCYRSPPDTMFGPNLAPDRNDPARVAAVNQAYRAVAAKDPRLHLIDLAGFLCPNAAFTSTIDGVQVRYDGVHFTDAGGQLVWKWLLPQILDLANPSPSPSSSDGEVTAFLIGDSVPYFLTQRYRDTVPGLRVTGSTQLGCGLTADPRILSGVVTPADADCAPWLSLWPQQEAKVQPNVGLVFVGVGELFDRQVDGQTLTFGSDAYASYLTSALDKAVTVFRDRGVPVILPTMPCHAVPDSGTSPEAGIINDPARIAWVNGVIASYVKQRDDAGVRVADLGGYLCSGPASHPTIADESTLRSDGLHFTDAGTKYVWDWLGPQVERLAGAKSANNG